MDSIAYGDAKTAMAIGDVIAFGGASVAAEVIKFATSSSVTHVGILMEPDVSAGDKVVRVVETLPRKGVFVMDLAERIEKSKVDVWWLPLREDVRQDLDPSGLQGWLEHILATRPAYDGRQVFGAAFDLFDDLPSWLPRPGYNREDLSELFCSELVAAALKAGNILTHVNASEVTPIEVCQWDIYRPVYYQLAGNPGSRIPKYNTRVPK